MQLDAFGHPVPSVAGGDHELGVGIVIAGVVDPLAHLLAQAQVADLIQPVEHGQGAFFQPAVEQIRGDPPVFPAAPGAERLAKGLPGIDLAEGR